MKLLQKGAKSCAHLDFSLVRLTGCPTPRYYKIINPCYKSKIKNVKFVLAFRCTYLSDETIKKSQEMIIITSEWWAPLGAREGALLGQSIWGTSDVGSKPLSSHMRDSYRDALIIHQIMFLCCFLYVIIFNTKVNIFKQKSYITSLQLRSMRSGVSGLHLYHEK